MKKIYEQRLAHALYALVEGLYYPGSEGDSLYYPVCVPMQDGPATAENLRQDLHLAKFWQLRLAPGTDWLDDVIQQCLDPNAVNDPNAARSYRDLRIWLLTNALDGPVLRLTAAPVPGKWHRTRHIVGCRVGKFFVGIGTESVET